MTIAARLDRLGTETAFAVSAEAAAHAAKGNEVFPFHLGDMNIRTPENIIAAAHNMEYNATHPAPKSRLWIDAFFTDTARKLITPAKLRKRKKLYHAYLEMISELEAKYDMKGVQDIAIFRRRTTAFLQEHLEGRK